MKFDRHGVELSLQEAERAAGLVIGFFFVFLSVAVTYAPIYTDKFMGNIITGFATISGILTAFVGFWFSYILHSLEGNVKNEIKRKMPRLITILFTGLLSVILGLSMMIGEWSRGVYVISLFGVALTVFASMDVLIIMHFTNDETRN